MPHWGPWSGWSYPDPTGKLTQGSLVYVCRDTSTRYSAELGLWYSIAYSTHGAGWGYGWMSGRDLQIDNHVALNAPEGSLPNQADCLDLVATSAVQASRVYLVAPTLYTGSGWVGTEVGTIPAGVRLYLCAKHDLSYFLFATRPGYDVAFFGEWWRTGWLDAANVLAQ